MSDPNTLQRTEEMTEIQNSFTDGERLFEVTGVNFRNPNCIDGRDDDCERPSIPGGAPGALGVVLATLDQTEKEYNSSSVINIVKDYFGENFSGHTDSHAEGGHQCQGCGHMARLTGQGKNYYLSVESSKALTEVANQIDTTKIKTLEGEHEEKCVIIVNIPGYGVKANHNGRQDFVYNLAYIQELYSQLAEKLSGTTEIEAEELMAMFVDMAEKHLMQTAGDLAANKNAYLLTDVNADRQPEVSFYTKIPANTETLSKEISDATSKSLD